MNRIPDEVIDTVLGEVEPDTYIEMLRPMLRAKRKSIKAGSDYELECKLIKFAMSRGFSVEEAREAMNC